jgi:5-methylcytosine-specific restriction protein A
MARAAKASVRSVHVLYISIYTGFHVFLVLFELLLTTNICTINVVFTALASAIDSLDIPVDGDVLAAAFALRDRLDARLTAAVEAFDRAELWDVEGATSITAWLADRARMSRPRAAATARNARLVARLPLTAAAWADGRLSSGQVEAICANLSPRLVDLFAHHEVGVLPSLYPLSAADVGTAMRAWRSHADDQPPEPEHPQTLHASPLLDGHVAVKGTLGAETGELLLTALRLAETGDVEGEPVRTVATRRADALGDICRFFLDHRIAGRSVGGRHRPHINLMFDLDAHGEITRTATASGALLDGVTARRLLCDSILHRVVTRGRSAILDYGHATRAILPPLWNVLLLRDQRCRFPGCDRRPEWCEAHHVVPWEKGGPTEPSNLALVCSRHHHVLHRPGWHARLLAGAVFEVTDPRGRIRTTSPPATGPPGAAPPGGRPPRGTPLGSRSAGAPAPRRRELALTGSGRRG